MASKVTLTDEQFEELVRRVLERLPAPQPVQPIWIAPPPVYPPTWHPSWPYKTYEVWCGTNTRASQGVRAD